MVVIIGMVTQEYNETSVSSFRLLSTDDKPTDCPNGSIVIEIDTGKKYRFDAEEKQWYDAGFAR